MIILDFGLGKDLRKKVRKEVGKMGMEELGIRRWAFFWGWEVSSVGLMGVGMCERQRGFRKEY